MTATEKTTAFPKTLARLGIAGLTATLLAGAATAHPNHHEDGPAFDPASYEFRASHPIRLFVDVDTRGEGRERHTTMFEARTLDKIRHNLPNYVQLVSNRRQANMVVRAQQTEYDLNFRVIDTDREDKKYKKKYRNMGGRCGHYIKAYYTEVKEKGEAYASYRVNVSTRGLGRNSNQIRLRSAENFTYGTNLMARTNCGMTPTDLYPSSGVAKLFSKASPAYRKHVANEIRQEAADDLGKVLARKVAQQADHYYADLSVRFSQGYGHDDDRNSDWSYRNDPGRNDGGDYGERFEYSHHDPRQTTPEDVTPSDEAVGAAVLVVAGLAILAASSGN